MTAGFQSTVNIELGFGIVGEWFDTSPHNAQPGMLNSGSAVNNVIGSYFTVIHGEGDDGTGAQTTQMQAGGTGALGGILANPKQYAAFGTSAGGPLAPTTTLANDKIADFATMGDINVLMPAACNIGDLVTYATATGVLASMPPTTVGTATQSTTTLTVVTPATGNIHPGSVVQIAGGESVRVLAEGQATGGAGTYTVDVSQTVTPAAAITATNIPASGYALVPNAQLVRYQLSAAGVAVARLNN
jgi:hypothetical protein